MHRSLPSEDQGQVAGMSSDETPMIEIEIEIGIGEKTGMRMIEIDIGIGIGIATKVVGEGTGRMAA